MADAMTMRNSALKKELNELCVNSRGVFDKHELAEMTAEQVSLNAKALAASILQVSS